MTYVIITILLISSLLTRTVNQPDSISYDTLLVVNDTVTGFIDTISIDSVLAENQIVCDTLYIPISLKMSKDCESIRMQQRVINQEMHNQLDDLKKLLEERKRKRENE